MRSKIGLIATLVIWLSFSLPAQQVRSSYDHNYDFSKIKTFTVRVTPAWGNATIEAYAKDVVAKELLAKGWTQAPNESSADVLVVIKGSVQNQKTEESFYDGKMMGGGVSGPAGVSNVRVIEEKLGEGTIDVFDAKTHDLIFSGAGAGEISAEEKKNEQRIKKGVEKVFKDFPPKAGA